MQNIDDSPEFDLTEVETNSLLASIPDLSEITDEEVLGPGELEAWEPDEFEGVAGVDAS